jgi:hypothetical protein
MDNVSHLSDGEIMQRTFGIGLALFIVGVQNSLAATLFDGTLGTLPASQSWIFQDPSGLATQSASGAGTTLNTLALGAIAAGYAPGPTIFPTLSRSPGFSVRLDAKLLSESHASTDRAGFSWLVLASDLKGVELGFWANEIWAQNDSPLFTHGEGATFNTTDAVHQFLLTVTGTSYQLSADGSPLLSGVVRDYTASSQTPYHTPNLVFVGDDTTSASASVLIARVEVVPEPSTAILAGLGSGLMTLGAIKKAARHKVRLCRAA